MKAIYDKTTARGDVYRAQIVGFLDGVDVSARAEVVVDGTTEPPRQVFYKDLSMNGKGFSDAILLGGSAVESVDPFGGGNEWGALDQATSGLFEIEVPGSAADPFAELDRQTGYRFDAPSVPNATANADAAPNVDPLAAGLGTGIGSGLETPATGATDLASTPQTLEETDPLGVPVGEIGASTDATAPETTPPAAPASRRDQLMNALETMRSNRRWRNSGASTDGGAAASEETPAPSETPPF
jgi:hypothetical protein